MQANFSERRNEPRRQEDRAFGDLSKTFSTSYCQQCLNHWKAGAILLDANLSVLFMTMDAEKIIKNKVSQLILEPRFSILESSQSRLFERFILDSGNKPGPLCLVLNESNISNHILLHCYRLPRQSDTDKAIAKYLVKLRCFNGFDTTSWTDFALAFGLTQAELRLCRVLYSGLTVKEYSAEWHITIGTARSQLHAVLGKTNTKRQSELMRLIMLYMQT